MGINKILQDALNQNSLVGRLQKIHSHPMFYWNEITKLNELKYKLEVAKNWLPK